MILSIITVNYNNANGLEQTICSVIKQNVPNIEFIIIDGASNDNSIDIIKQYEDKISYWVSEPDNGIYHAMNKGIQKAKGKYLLFLNSSDILDPSIDFYNILNLLESGEDLICFNMKMGTNSSSYIRVSPDKPDFAFFVLDALPHQATFIKKACLVEYGYYNENVKISSDWIFFIDMICLRNCSYKHIDLTFSIFDLEGISSDINNADSVYKERDIHIKQYYPQYYSIYLIYKDWKKQKEIVNEQRLLLNRIKSARSIKLIKQIGMLKWLNIS